jgi:SAM-dependent methyltransferase
VVTPDPVTSAAAAAPGSAYDSVFACPITGESLIAVAGGFATQSGSRIYPVADGIAEFFVPTDAMNAVGDVTEIVKAFYEETPFPNYAEDETRETLATKARRNLFVRALDAELPDDAVVLEAGCGTGQLTNFLGLSPDRHVIGGDICRNSLRLANEFRARERIANAAFVQMNLFRPPFRPASLDVVIANGVLHHTADARAGFAALLRAVKPGGVIVIGLYNRYARLATLARRQAFARFGRAAHFLDRRVLPGALNEQLRQAWFRDQYQHPHETRHSIDEVMGWLDAAGVDFLSSIPPADGSAFTAASSLFSPGPRGTRASRLAVQLGLLLAGGRDGGLFIVCGRKRG